MSSTSEPQRRLRADRIRVRRRAGRRLSAADEASDRSHPRGPPRAAAGGQIYPPERIDTALNNFFKIENLAALREVALRQVAEEVESKRLVREVIGNREDRMIDTAAQAVGERLLALIRPIPRSQRLVRRAWRSAQRLGADLDLLWVRSPGQKLSANEQDQLDALGRLASVLGARLLVEEGDDLVQTVRDVVEERGSTYVLIGTPSPRTGLDRFRPALATRLIEALPGVDLRVVADRTLRDEGDEGA
jgi:two-component system sensor histidine kinase KdpD